MIGPLVIYFDFLNPPPQSPLPTRNWKVTSNANPSEAIKAIDQEGQDPVYYWSIHELELF